MAESWEPGSWGPDAWKTGAWGWPDLHAVLAKTEDDDALAATAQVAITAKLGSEAWAPGAWDPGAWQQGAWDSGEIDAPDVLTGTMVVGDGGVRAQLAQTEDDDRLAATGVIKQKKRAVVAGVGGGGGRTSMEDIRRWLAKLTSPREAARAVAIGPGAVLGSLAANEDGDALAATATVTGRSRRARDEELILRRAA